MTRLLVIFMCTSTLLFACREQPASPTAGPVDSPPSPTASPAWPPKTLHFTDVTEASGLDVVMTSGQSPSREILEVNGGGLGLIDYDDDGDLDIFVANGATMERPAAGPGSRLYRNDGALRFTDVTAAAGITLRRWAMGVTVGDADGDGRDDLYVTCFGPNVLLRNTGDGRFEDVTNRAGVGDERWGTSAAFADLDADGDLDLYVVNYLEFDPAQPPPRAKYKNTTVMNGPHGLVPQADVLYDNRGDGTFRDVSEESGVAAAAPSFGLNVIVVDLDDDGRQDIIVGNDSMANFYFHHLGRALDDGAFEEIGLATGIAANMDGSNQATMGMAVADVDGNGRPDLFSSNFSSDTNTLHLNLDGLYFDDRTRQHGLGQLSRPYLGWASWFADFDHDGDEDLLVVNGHVYPEATVESMDSPYEQTPLLFARDGRRFRRVTDAGDWLAVPHRDRTAAYGDLDGDGDVDVIVGELNGPVRVLRNDAADDRPDWLIVELRDAGPGVGNWHGFGSRIDLTQGESTLRRWLFTGGGFQSSSAPAVHFGLPAATPVTLEIRWPDGTIQTVRDVAPGRKAVVRKPPGPSTP